MNASDIKNFVFAKSAFGGFKPEDVRACLKEISEYVLGLEETTYKLDRENKTLKAKLLELEKTQDEIKEIMISAQDFKHKILKEAEDKTNELVTQARDKAKAIEDEAQQKADGQLQQAIKQLEDKKNQYDELQKMVSEFKLKLMEIYKKHIDLITKLPEITESKIEKFGDKSDLIEVENESEVFENLQESQESGDGKEAVMFGRVQRNLSGNENIFKKSASKNSDKNVLNRVGGRGDDYIKSRFEELER